VRRRLPLLLSENSSLWLHLRVLFSARVQGGSDPRARLQQLLTEIDELLLAEIAERRTDPTLSEREDILSLLIGARFEDGGQMSDRELRDQLLTLLLAGHETTATALAWTIDLLLRHPEKLERLTQEVMAGEQDEYLRATIAEALRLRPVVPLAGRRLAVELDVEGLRLPAGTDVTPAIWLTHMRSDLYPQPREFRPERFLTEQPTTYGWIPFGGGIRRCLGAAFAEFEMRIVLQSLLASCDLRPVGRRSEAIARRNVTFSPRRGTRVRLVSRAAAPSATPAGAAEQGVRAAVA
jgi:cytochrome P450 family 135